MKVAKLHERIRFRRKDYLEKVSTWISRNYSTVCVESLKVMKMINKKNHNHNLSREIGDCGWGMFIEMLCRKCDQVLMIDTYFPSSQTCSVCGHIEKSVKNLNVRTWVCPVCGTVHDRDFNAAQNILREGLSLCGPKVNLSSTCPKIPLASAVGV
jgi:putative transposase